MIVVFPMLTSDTISQNVLPGICKALERFVIVYRLDRVLKRIDKSINVKFNVLGKHINVKENTIHEIGKGSPFTGGSGGGKNKQDKDKKGSPLDVKVTGGSGGGDKVQIDYPNQKDLTLEPTYITVNTKSGPALIGIKVLPFPVKSKKKNMNIVQMMQSDRDMKRGEAIVTGMRRYTIQALYGLWRGTLGRFSLLNRTITGDARKDILWGSTQFGLDTFVLLNMMDLKQAFLQDPGYIKKLHFMGWRSFAIADEVNRKVSFCMKEFGGVCTVVPYSYLFSSLGKDQKTTFDDLEDVRKSSTPFFRTKVPRSRVIGEQYADSLKSNMQMIDEATIIQEGIFDFIKRIGSKNVDKMKNDSKAAISRSDPKAIVKILNKVPDVKLSKLRSYGQKQNPQFLKSYSTAKRVIDNSLPPEVDIRLKDSLATVIAFKAIARDGDIAQHTKDELKIILPVTMSFLGSTAMTTGWVMLWCVIASMFVFSLQTTIAVCLLIIARGMLKYTKNVKKELSVAAKHKRVLDKMAMGIEKQKAKGPRVPLVNVNRVDTSNSNKPGMMPPGQMGGA